MVVLFSRFGYNEINIHTYIHTYIHTHTHTHTHIHTHIHTHTQSDVNPFATNDFYIFVLSDLDL